MHTAIVEIGGIINFCPISYLSSDDVEEPLTPSQLLVGCSILNLPDHLTYHEDGDEEFEIIDEALQRRAKYLSSVLNHFWERRSKKWTSPEGSTSTSTDIRGGDVVLVHDQDHPWGFWKMARVQKLITGRDGQTCGAVLKLPTNSRRFTTLQRPVQLIYPLLAGYSELYCGDSLVLSIYYCVRITVSGL